MPSFNVTVVIVLNIILLNVIRQIIILLGVTQPNVIRLSVNLTIVSCLVQFTNFISLKCLTYFTHLQPSHTFMGRSRGLYYKTFYGRNLQISVIRWSACPWQAFPGLGVRPEPTQVSREGPWPYPQTLDYAGKDCQGQKL